MVRGLIMGILAAGAMSAGGCTPEGSVEITWQFPALAGGTGEPETAPAGCGNHGVDSVRLDGTSSEGDVGNIIALCTAGSVKRTVPAASWSFRVFTLDIQGRLIRAADDPDAVTETLAVSDGGAAAFATITLPPRPACADTVDNDRDGRVDLDDPDCAGDPADTDESASPRP